MRLTPSRQHEWLLDDPVCWSMAVAPLLFFGWMLFSPDSIGNDYPVYQVDAALSLRWYATVGLEPMWYPHLTGGVPIGALTMGQPFHPPAWLLSLLPGYWSGRALIWITVRHLALLAFGQAVYYAAMRRVIGLGRFESWLVSFLAIYNLRTLDALRYGTALDGTFYGHALLLLSSAYALAPAPPRLWLLAIAGLTQLLMTAGYPVVLPFAALSALLILPSVVLRARSERRRLAGRVAEIALAALVGVAMAAPYIVTFAEWLSVNDKRVLGSSLAWASRFPMDGLSMAANLAAPWEAEVHSSFTGATAFNLVFGALLIASLRDARRCWPLVPIVAFPFLYAWGARSPLYLFFFRHVPGFASIRGPGRALYMLPLLLFGVLLWLVSLRRERRESVLLAGARASAWVNGVALGAGLALAVGGPAWLSQQRYAAARLSEFWSAGPRVLWLLLGFAACVSFRRALAGSRAARLALLLVTLVQTSALLRHGTWVAPRQETARAEQFAGADHLPLYGTWPLLAKNELLEPEYGTATTAYTLFVKLADAKANCFAPIHPDLRERGVLLPFYLSTNLVCAPDERDVLSRLAEERCRPGRPVRTYVVGADCQVRAPDANADLARLNERNHLLGLTPNGASLAVEPDRESVLVTPYPEATANWTATVDGRPTPLQVVNGAFLGVRVPAGPHLVSVRYFSEALVLGHRVAAAAALASIVFAVLRLVATLRIALALCVALGLSGTLGYAGWETQYRDRTARAVSLRHDYPAILERQLQRWRQP